jgi:hypothetical protein
MQIANLSSNNVLSIHLILAHIIVTSKYSCEIGCKRMNGKCESKNVYHRIIICNEVNDNGN